MAQRQAVAALRAALGPDIVALPDEFGGRQVKDWSGLPGAAPLALIRPRGTADVSAALRLCKQYRQPVAVQGGLTGLAGGANARDGEVVLNLERMNRIVQVDVTSATITAQAGVPLQRLQEAASDAGLYFPLDLGARGSCTLGGNLATNAGGNRVIKYGMMRDQVLGLEAVLADGQVINAMHKMIKNNTGYDLRHLLIGSEGTLAVMTQAVLRLRPHPRATATAWCGLLSFDAVTAFLAASQAALASGVSAFEVMWAGYYDAVLAHLPNLRAPLADPYPFHVLLESVGGDPDGHSEAFEAFLTRMLEDGVVADAAIAASASDAQAFWSIRDAPGEYSKFIPRHAAYDISFSIADVGRVAEQCRARLLERWPDALVMVYGHLGDGNLHIVVDVPDAGHALHPAFDAVIYDVTRAFHGSISAEHGIGMKKKSFLEVTRSVEEIGVMRAIKTALDPDAILNPGRIF